MSQGYVYFLSNPSIPELIKIGFTHRELEKRIAELRATGVPTPFALIAAFLVNSPDVVERKIHEELKTFRVESDREFFRIPAADALKQSSNILFSALVSEANQNTEELDRTIKLEHFHVLLLEFAFGGEHESNLVEVVASDYGTHYQVVHRFADDLVDWGLLTYTKGNYKLSRAGRKVCFEDPQIDLGMLLEIHKP